MLRGLLSCMRSGVREEGSCKSWHSLLILRDIQAESRMCSTRFTQYPALLVAGSLLLQHFCARPVCSCCLPKCVYGVLSCTLRVWNHFDASGRSLVLRRVPSHLASARQTFCKQGNAFACDYACLHAFTLRVHTARSADSRSMAKASYLGCQACTPGRAGAGAGAPRQAWATTRVSEPIAT